MNAHAKAVPSLDARASVAPTLGELLAAARSQSSAFADWLSRNDPPLHARLAGALADGETASERIRRAVGAFVQLAGNEEWVRLVSTARDDKSPGLAALRMMLDWSLAEEARH